MRQTKQNGKKRFRKKSTRRLRKKRAMKGGGVLDSMRNFIKSDAEKVTEGDIKQGFDILYKTTSREEFAKIFEIFQKKYKKLQLINYCLEFIKKYNESTNVNANCASQYKDDCYLPLTQIFFMSKIIEMSLPAEPPAEPPTEPPAEPSHKDSVLSFYYNYILLILIHNNKYENDKFYINEIKTHLEQLNSALKILNEELNLDISPTDKKNTYAEANRDYKKITQFNKMSVDKKIQLTLNSKPSSP